MPVCFVGTSTAEFIPTTTESGSTNLPEGIVHVYRQCDERRQNGVDESNRFANASETISEDGFMLGVLAVPAWMTPSDFLAFVAPAAEGMAHLRLIRYAFIKSIACFVKLIGCCQRLLPQPFYCCHQVSAS